MRNFFISFLLIAVSLLTLYYSADYVSVGILFIWLGLILHGIGYILIGILLAIIAICILIFMIKRLDKNE